MSLIKARRKKIDSIQVRKEFEFYYNEKFFNKWMGKFKFDGLNYQQQRYIMKKWWSSGNIACSRPVNIPNNLGIDLGEDSVIFTPFAPQDVYNIYDFPTKATPINTRGVNFISSEPLKIDEEIVIGYIQYNHKSILSSIEAKINQLIDLEMTIRTSTFTQKMPWLIGATPENKEEMEELVSGLESDDPVLFTALEEPEKAKSLISGAPYVLDKLEQMRQKIENDILSILGCNNVGIAEKKEHMLDAEINANNQDIQENSDQYLEMAEKFFDRIEKVFGQKISVSLAHEVEENNYQEDEGEDDEQID